MRSECESYNGRLKEICEGTANLGFDTINKYRASWGLSKFTEEEYAEIEKIQPVKPKIKKNRELVGTHLKKRIDGLIKIKTGKGCGCNNLANDMDNWGIDGCLQRKDLIVDHLVNNRSILIEALKEVDGDFIKSTLGSVLEHTPDFLLIPVLKLGAAKLFDLAIEDTERIKKELESRRPKTFKTKVCEVKSNLIIMPLTEEQRKLHKEALTQKPDQDDPFINEPIVHFGAHLWAIKGYWKSHVDKWNELAEEINGRCIVGISISPETDTFEDVSKYFSERFELFQIENTGEGENPSFRQIINMVPTGNDDVLIYSHGKGVRPHTCNSESVKIWTEQMYETVVFNYKKAVEKFKEGYRTFGSFRTFGDIPLSPKHRWHYSGTFFIVRAKYLPNTKIKKGYGGVECWPGDNIETKYSFAEFLDGQQFKLGYDLGAMYPRIVDMQMQWEVDRLGGPRCEQHKRELDWFLNHINESDKILVIGSKHGGLEHQIRLKHPNISIVSCDIAPQKNNVEFVIVGDSADQAIKEKILQYGPYDVVFIDGDHTYEGVKKDWDFAISLSPRLIAFHDVAKAIKHDKENCKVDVLWKEIKECGFKTEEKIVGCGWGGIGIVWMI